MSQSSSATTIYTSQPTLFITRLSGLRVTSSVISNRHSIFCFNISLLSVPHSQLQCVLIKATVINGVRAYLCEGFKGICKSYPCILNEFRVNSITF